MTAIIIIIIIKGCLCFVHDLQPTTVDPDSTKFMHSRSHITIPDARGLEETLLELINCKYYSNKLGC